MTPTALSVLPCMWLFGEEESTRLILESPRDLLIAGLSLSGRVLELQPEDMLRDR